MAIGELVGPRAELRFRRRIGLLRAFKELWNVRELVRTLAEREMRVRYKQATLGFAWAVVTPVALMIVFTLVRSAVGATSGDIPYPLFAFVGLIPWTFFSTSLSHGGQSLIQNVPLLNKVYCPREVFPIASVTVAAVDSAIAAGFLLFLFPLFGFVPRATAVWIPVLLLIQVTFTLAVVIITSGLMVYLRDIRHALPLILQLGVLANPMAYGIEKIPSEFRQIYCALNPLGAVIDGYRQTILFGRAPDWELVVPAAIGAVVMLTVGYVAFKRMETGFADVA
jgi:ABC-type polysaccharide/polyol phosphate export permease